MYAIKDSYQENPTPAYFLDDVTETRGLVFQPDVYTLAEWIAETSRSRKIVDVGCGWGDKLAGIHARHPDWIFKGFDHGENIAHCETKYEWGRWFDRDLEVVTDLAAENAVAICSDVIEHLINPRSLVESLRRSNAKAILISTPERDIQHGADHNGPSPNLCHMREWNASELHAFLTGEGLTVQHLGLTRGHDQSWVMPTQIAICTP